MKPINSWNLDPAAKPLPQPDSAECQVEYLHVYDFDNTLFHTPEPNPRLWTQSTRNFVQSSKNFTHGSWWTNPAFLQVTGEGMAVEEGRAWAGWWNEEVVELVQETMHDPRALGVLLTGRNKERFGDLLQRMVSAKGLKFDLMSLRTDEFKDTIEFKLACLRSLLQYYHSKCKAVYIYEDRPYHVSIFRGFLRDWNLSNRTNLEMRVVEVVPIKKWLDPRVEVNLMRKVIEAHNETSKIASAPSNTYAILQLEHEHQYSGYVIMPESRAVLLNQFGNLSVLAFSEAEGGLQIVAAGGSTSTHSNDIRKKVRYMCDCVVVQCAEKKTPQQQQQQKQVDGHYGTGQELYPNIPFYGDAVKWRVIAAGGFKGVYFLKVEPLLTPEQSQRKQPLAAVQSYTDAGVGTGVVDPNFRPVTELYVPVASVAKNKRPGNIQFPVQAPEHMWQAVSNGPIIETLYGDIGLLKILKSNCRR